MGNCRSVAGALSHPAPITREVDHGPRACLWSRAPHRASVTLPPVRLIERGTEYSPSTSRSLQRSVERAAICQTPLLARHVFYPQLRRMLSDVRGSRPMQHLHTPRMSRPQFLRLAQLRLAEQKIEVVDYALCAAMQSRWYRLLDAALAPARHVHKRTHCLPWATAVALRAALSHPAPITREVDHGRRARVCRHGRRIGHRSRYRRAVDRARAPSTLPRRQDSLRRRSPSTRAAICQTPLLSTSPSRASQGRSPLYSISRACRALSVQRRQCASICWACGT